MTKSHESFEIGSVIEFNHTPRPCWVRWGCSSRKCLPHPRGKAQLRRRGGGWCACSSACPPRSPPAANTNTIHVILSSLKSSFSYVSLHSTPAHSTLAQQHCSPWQSLKLNPLFICILLMSSSTGIGTVSFLFTTISLEPVTVSGTHRWLLEYLLNKWIR